MIEKAVELLMRLDTIHQERTDPLCSREDVVWALDPARDQFCVKVGLSSRPTLVPRPAPSHRRPRERS